MLVAESVDSGLSENEAIVGAIPRTTSAPLSGAAFAFDLEPADCNGNGQLQVSQLAANPSLDCNANFILDVCDIAGGTDSTSTATPSRTAASRSGRIRTARRCPARPA